MTQSHKQHIHDHLKQLLTDKNMCYCFFHRSCNQQYTAYNPNTHKHTTINTLP